MFPRLIAGTGSLCPLSTAITALLPVSYVERQPWSWGKKQAVTDDRELLNELNQVGQELGPFTARILTNTASADQQFLFSYQLIRLAGEIQARAKNMPVRPAPHSTDGNT